MMTDRTDPAPPARLEPLTLGEHPDVDHAAAALGGVPFQTIPTDDGSPRAGVLLAGLSWMVFGRPGERLARVVIRDPEAAPSPCELAGLLRQIADRLEPPIPRETVADLQARAHGIPEKQRHVSRDKHLHTAATFTQVAADLDAEAANPDGEVTAETLVPFSRVVETLRLAAALQREFARTLAEAG